MKIIKQGISGDELNHKLKQTRSFECRTCGCVFEAERDKCGIEIAYPRMFYYCDCPNCKARSFSDGIQDGFYQTGL